MSVGDLALLDRAAQLANLGNTGFAQLRALYRGERRLRAPPELRR